MISWSFWLIQGLSLAGRARSEHALRMVIVIKVIVVADFMMRFKVEARVYFDASVTAAFISIEVIRDWRIRGLAPVSMARQSERDFTKCAKFCPTPPCRHYSLFSVHKD